MNTLAVAVIAAGAAIASAIITAVLSSRKIDKNLALHEKDSGHRSSDLSKEHTDISKSVTQIGGSLSREHRELEKIISGETQAIGGLATDLRFLRDEQIESKNRQQTLSTQQLDIKQTTDHIVAMVSELSRLQSENQSLRQENNGLTKTNEQLTQINHQLLTRLERPPEHTKGGEHDWEPDF